MWKFTDFTCKIISYVELEHSSLHMWEAEGIFTCEIICEIQRNILYISFTKTIWILFWLIYIT